MGPEKAAGRNYELLNGTEEKLPAVGCSPKGLVEDAQIPRIRTERLELKNGKIRENRGVSEDSNNDNCFASVTAQEFLA